MGQRRSREQWDRIVAAYVESGLSRAAFATAFGVPLGTLQYQLGRRGRLGATGSSNERGFVEVPWSRSPPAASADTLTVEVRLGDHLAIRASTWPPASWLAEVLGSVARDRC